MMWAFGAVACASTSSTTTANSSAPTADAATASDTATAPDTPPVDAAPPPEPFVEGDNVLVTAGLERHVRVYFPADVQQAPVVFAWHGSGDKAKSFASALQASKLAQATGAIVVVPDACSNTLNPPPANCAVLPFTWGWKFEAGGIDAPLFDDVLARLAATASIDSKRIYSLGFSAGALQTTWLLMNRADKLAAAVTFSGGTSDFLPYQKPVWPLPVMAFSGGASDQVIIQFAESTADMVQHLVADGSFVIDCKHNQGHTVPSNGLTAAWKFLSAQTLGQTESPTAATGAQGFPSYCKVAGNL
jgi:predicted esterase